MVLLQNGDGQTLPQNRDGQTLFKTGIDRRSLMVGMDRRSFKTGIGRAPSALVGEKQPNLPVLNLVLLKNPHWMGFLSTRNNKRDFFPIYVLLYTYVLYIHIYYPLTPFYTIQYSVQLFSCFL